MHLITELERGEALLWTLLARFESLAVAQYAVAVPSLVTAEKRALIAYLRTRVRGGDELAGTRLETPIAALIETVTSNNERRVLIAQGLFLEFVGDAMYRSFGENEASGESTRALCKLGSSASARARALIPALLRERVGTGDVLFQAIMTEAGPMLRSLDDLGEGIDASFADRFGVSFADLMGDVAADLIAVCVELDVDRRKFVAFLTSALMGI